MSAVSEREKSARLRSVMAAAKHVLAEDARVQDRPKEFASGSVFPDGADRRTLSNAEYSWRQQLAWGWEKAGYMHVRVEGKGLHKHYVYTLTNEGREALAHIASDPVIASFYVSRKRSYDDVSRDTEWYQPPELRADGAVDDARANENENESDDEGAEAGDVPETDQAPPGDPAATTLAVFFDRSIAVLERMDSRLEAFDERMARLEAEVKTQSDLVLSVAGRAESGATTADVAAAARGVTRAVTDAAIAISKSAPNVKGEVLVLQASLDTIREDVVQMRTTVDDLSARPAPAAATTMTAATLPDDVLESLRGLVALRTKVDAIATTLSAPLEMTVGDGDSIGKIAAALDRLAPSVTTLLAKIGEAEEAYLKTLQVRRADLATLNSTMSDLSAAAESVIDGAKFVAGELISRSLERAVAEGTPASVAHQQQARALETFAAVKNAVKNRSTALGGALLRIQPFAQTGKLDPILPPPAVEETGRK